MVLLGGFEQGVIDKAAGERGVLPVDTERLAQLARIAVEVAPGQQQDRHGLAGKQPKRPILGEQNPLLPGTALDKLPGAPTSLRQKTGLAGRSEPADEAA